MASASSNNSATTKSTKTSPTSDKRPNIDLPLNTYSPYELKYAQAKFSVGLLNSIIEDAKKKKATYSEQATKLYETLYRAEHPQSPGDVKTDAEKTQLRAQWNAAKANESAQVKLIDDKQKELNKAKADLLGANSTNKSIDFGKNTAPQGAKNQNSTGGNNTKPDNSPTPKPLIQYNAPMVTSAYTRGLAEEVARRSDLISAPGNNQIDLQNWVTKGAIQVSKHFADLNAANLKKNPKGNLSSIYDPQMYGFKFLYNPGLVSMAWGIVEQFSPQFEQMGFDRANAISVGLMKSAIVFTLKLNRIGDMNFIDEYGLRSGLTEGANAASRATYPYPYAVNDKELAQIYKRGTMYDLEYLFRVCGGYNSQYKSTLNGQTADRGWLAPIPVELHLGEGLRYLVRISQLDVNHTHFNPRMVPVLTDVTITCTRYFDGPEMFSTANDGLNLGQTAFGGTSTSTSTSTSGSNYPSPSGGNT